MDGKEGYAAPLIVSGLLGAKKYSTYLDFKATMGSVVFVETTLGGGT